MPTIITVHGTFAGGPDHGDKWWQKDSPFERHLRELIETDDGQLNWQPAGWDGLNSETSRRGAGLKLYEVMQEHESRAEPYCVIGHSHGGSVISAALSEAAEKGNSLPHLRTWLTIATPFITSEKNRFLFSRLGTFGQAAYAGLVLGALVGAFSSSLDFLGEAVEIAGFGVGVGFPVLILVVLQIVASLAVPLVLIYAAVRHREKGKLLLYSGSVRKFLEANFARRWTSLWHCRDEAVQGLKLLRALDVNIFYPTFAISAFRGFIIVLLLLAWLVFLCSPSAVEAFYEAVKEPILSRTFVSNILLSDGRLIGEGRNVVVNAILFLTVVGQALAVAFTPIFNWADVNLVWYQGVPARLLKSVFFVASASVLTIGLMWLVQLASIQLSRIASKLLNPVAAGQIRAKGFGGDTDVDKAIGAMEFPMWLGHGRPPLPEALGSEVEHVSDKAAAAVIPKFRGALNDLSRADGMAQTSDMLLSYLTWNELIHTTYFNVPRFVKLVAYALAQQEGFRASAGFMQDPDFKLAAAWYEEVSRDQT